MNKRIDSVMVNDHAGTLRLSSRLGYNTIMPVFLACVVLSVIWILAATFMLPPGWIVPAIVPPVALAAAYLGLAALVNRTRVTTTERGIEWGTRPLRVPSYPWRRSLRVEQIAAIFVSPCAISGRYVPTYVHSYEVFALSADGAAERLLSRVRKLDSARELAALIEGRLRLTRGRVIPPLSSVSRSIAADAEQIPTRKHAAFLFPLLIVLGLAVFASPWLRMASKTEVIGTVSDVGWATRMGAKRSYRQQICYVDFQTPQGPVSVTFEENCPRTAKTGDKLTIFYDPGDPQRFVVPSIAQSLFGLLFFLPGLCGLIYLVVTRKPQAAFGPRLLDEDRFRFLNPYWDLHAKNAVASKGVLVLNADPGSALTPFLCRSSFSSPMIDLMVRPRSGLSNAQAAGIQFWADGLGECYVFAVAPVPAVVEVWRVKDGKWVTVVPPFLYARTAEGFIALRVVTRGNKADLFVNGASVATISGEPPPGGSVAGLAAIFPKDTNAIWEFAGFCVSAT